MSTTIREQSDSEDSVAARVEPASWLRRVSERLKQKSQLHLFFAITLALGIWAVWSVPQIKNLWQQSPPFELRLLLLKYMAFVMAVFLFYLPSLLVVVPWSPRAHFNKERGSLLDRLLFLSGRAAAGWLNVIAERIGQLGRLAAGLVLTLVWSIVWIKGSPIEGSRLYPLAGAFCQFSGALMLAMGLWLTWRFASQTFLKKDIGLGWYAVGRGLSWLAVASLIGEVIWALAGFQWLGASYRIYSIWALVHYFSILIIAGSLIDYCHHKTAWPVRQLAALAVLFMIWWQGPQRVQDGRLEKNTALADAYEVEQNANVAAAGVATDSDWYDAALARLESMPSGPAVIVAPSGGGSRAAIFAALVFETLSRTDLNALPIDAAGAAAPPGSVAPPASKWSDNIFLISSVSGGSLATADYVCRYPNPRPEQDGMQHSSRDEIIARMRQHLQILLDDRKFTGTARENLEKARVLLGQRDTAPDEKIEWLYRSALVDEMCIDFMAPILRGMQTPGATHGDTLAHFWSKRFQWRDYDRLNWTSRFAPGEVPLMLLNATDVDYGARLAVGFPALPANLFGADEEQTPNMKRGDRRTHAFSEYDPDRTCSLNLARAVRLSSNFPFGFPVSVLDEHSTPSLRNIEKPIRILDGGVVDNTGLDTVRNLFRALAVHAKVNTKAQAILDQLRRRGVVIVEIDSGAKPVPRDGWGLLAAVTQPAQALNNATYTNAEQAKESYQDEIRRLLRVSLNVQRPEAIAGEVSEELISSFGGDIAPTVHWHSFACNHIQSSNAEVMTAWALGPYDKAAVLAQFVAADQEWQRFTADLPKLVDKARRSVARARDAAHAFMVEELLAKVRKSMDETYRQLQRLEAQVSSGDNAYFETAQQIIQQFESQRDLLKEAEALAEKTATEDHDAIAGLQERLEENIEWLAAAKGLDAERVKEVVLQTRAQLQVVGALNDTLRSESRNATQESSELRRSVEDIQEGYERRARQAKQAYLKRAYRD